MGSVASNDGAAAGATHYVLKTNLSEVPPGHKVAVFGNGCFWGSEKGFWRMPGVTSTAVGYCGGASTTATYEQVCGGSTGHAEAVRVVYDPSAVTYADLLRYFWESHDPTTKNRQGNDAGSQYRSLIACQDAEQRALAEASMAAYDGAIAKAGARGKCTTEIVGPEPSVPPFVYGEVYHQQYLAKPGSRPYCSAQPMGISLPPASAWAPAPATPEGANKLPGKYWDKFAPSPGCVLRQRNDKIDLSSL